MPKLNFEFFLPYTLLSVLGIALVAWQMIKNKKSNNTDTLLSDWAVIIGLVSGFLAIFVIKSEGSLFEPIILAQVSGITISQTEDMPTEVNESVTVVTRNLGGVSMVTYRIDDGVERSIHSNNEKIAIPKEYCDGGVHALTIKALPDSSSGQQIAMQNTYYFRMNWLSFSTNGFALGSDMVYIVNDTQEFEYTVLLNEKVTTLVYAFDDAPLVYALTEDDPPAEGFAGRIAIPAEYADGKPHMIVARARAESGGFTAWNTYWFRTSTQ